MCTAGSPSFGDTTTGREGCRWRVVRVSKGSPGPEKNDGEDHRPSHVIQADVTGAGKNTRNSIIRRRRRGHRAPPPRPLARSSPPHHGPEPACRAATSPLMPAIQAKAGPSRSAVYTDRYRSHDALMFRGYRHLRVDHGKYFSRGRVHISGVEGFWSYAKERIMKYAESPRKGSLVTSRSWSSGTIIARRTSSR